MSGVLWGVALALGLYGLHRLALWMESRGWIFYMKTRAGSGALGSAFLEIQRIAQPEKKFVLEIRQDHRVQHDSDAGMK